MNGRALLAATLIGCAAQLGMVIAGHYVGGIAELFAPGGMAISLVAGWIYAARAGEGWRGSLVGGAIAGAGCALLGIAVSVALKDTAWMVLGLGTCASAITGLVGGMIGKLLTRGALPA